MSIVVTHWPVPTQPPPDQPSKYDSAPGVALSVTTVPWLYVSLQSVPQSILPSVDFTVPALAALPVFATVNEYALTVNVAVVVIGAAVVVNMHVVDAEPSKYDSAPGVALSVTTVPWLYVSLQSVPQSILPSVDFTVPALAALPVFATVNEYALTVNVAVVVIGAAVVVNMHVVDAEPS